MTTICIGSWVYARAAHELRSRIWQSMIRNTLHCTPGWCSRLVSGFVSFRRLVSCINDILQRCHRWGLLSVVIGWKLRFQSRLSNRLYRHQYSVADSQHCCPFPPLGGIGRGDHIKCIARQIRERSIQLYHHPFQIAMSFQHGQMTSGK